MSELEDEFSKNCKEIEEINKWYGRQSSINLSEGLEKLKEGDEKIKRNKRLLEEFMNEYRNIRPEQDPNQIE